MISFVNDVTHHAYGDAIMALEEQLKEIVVPKEEAVFWMDRFGHWHNEGGRFEHKKIIDYFNAAIRRDQDGYFVQQVRDDLLEKVYFKYEDTPLFVVDAVVGEGITLLINTGETLSLETDQLFIHKDHLYLQRGEDRIKFLDRVLLKLADCIDEDPTNGFFLLTADGRFPIPER